MADEAMPTKAQEQSAEPQPSEVPVEDLAPPEQQRDQVAGGATKIRIGGLSAHEEP